MLERACPAMGRENLDCANRNWSAFLQTSPSGVPPGTSDRPVRLCATRLAVQHDGAAGADQSEVSPWAWAQASNRSGYFGDRTRTIARGLGRLLSIRSTAKHVREIASRN